MPLGSQERPYRSHLRPACFSCRKRKSRCKIESHSTSCLMCRVHGTECLFPKNGQTDPVQGSVRSPRPHTRGQTVAKDTIRRHQPSPTTSCHSRTGDTHQTARDNSDITIVDSTTTWVEKRTPLTHLTVDNGQVQSEMTPLSIEDTENENAHIISPAVTSDNQVLSEYLSTMSNSTYGIRLIRSKRANSARQVLFTAVQKRPVGLTINPNPSYTKCEIIEKLLEPWTGQLIDIYFRKANICLPLLDESSFRSRYITSKERISPALLSSLYAHSLVYWKSEPLLPGQRCPDIRFIWNLSTEALQSELFLSPGISTITAILLNIGGRPTTAIVGNGVRLGSAVSLAYSLGLNRNPLSWDISWSEKVLRMHIWWSLLIHDRWSSLAYGTPPHLQKSLYDVPQPTAEYQLDRQDPSQRHPGAISVFFALSGLTDVLDHYLQRLYRLEKETNMPITSMELRLNRWVEGLVNDVRQIITRGTSLHIPGAPNLRLAYLSVQLLIHRIQMEDSRAKDDVDEDSLANQYICIRRTAEDLVFLIQELRQEQLDDFWLPVTAFAFPSAITFLLRCALETVRSPNELSKSGFVKLAWDLITTLRSHKSLGWDLGDICLAQYAEVVEKLAAPVDTNENSATATIYEDIIIPDDLFVDDIFSNFEG
ncbi:fungal-specific transcription factor domain-containing protein [Hypoxylon sp. NC0597]|nr:fungal-specific transcription factor domain-containing protein [Hypoxylon sp. NC0597]